MGFADDKFKKYLQKNLMCLKNITIDEMLPHLTPCLSLATVEKLNAYVRNQGSRKSVMDFFLDLIRGDEWPKYFINALKECKHEELAKEFEEVYASYQLPTKQSGPLSLPASLSQYNHQLTQESPQRQVNQIQPEQQKTQRSPSQHNHEFRSLPPFHQDPPTPPRNPLSHNVSEPVHSDGRTVDDTSRNPVPETTPYQTTLPVGDFEALQKDESSISENPPNLKEPLPGVSIKPSSQDVSPIKVDNVPDRNPASYRPVNRETVQGEPSRTWQADQWAPSGSSCRPLVSNNEEEYLSKPGALESTLGFADITVVGGGSSVMSHSHDLQISDDTEMNESSNATARSSSTSITQKKVPLASTPNNTSIKHSPEENDFMFDSRSSPGRNRHDHFSSKQPEENSFASSDVRHYSLQFNERPEENLMGSNDDTLRNRPRKSPNSGEPNNQNTQKKTSKTAEGRDRERAVLITITVASVCLSLYLLWKI